MLNKAIYLFLVICFSQIAICLAQDKEDSKWSVGAIVSGNVSKIKAVDVIYYGSGSRIGNGDYQFGAGYGFGPTLNFKMGKRLAAQTQLTFIFNKTTYNPIGLDNTMEIQSSTQFKWLELPLVLNYSYLISKKVDLFVGTGLAISKRLRVKNETTVTYMNTSSGTSLSDLTEQTNSWNLSPQLQLGSTFPVNQKNRISLVVIYQQNLLYLYKSPDYSGLSPFDFGTTESNGRLATLSFSVIYSFLPRKAK